MTKKRPILSTLVFVVIFTFLWSQIVFALELPDHPLQNNITSFNPAQKNLPINLHKIIQKQLSRLSLSTIYEKIKPTLKYCLIAIYAKPNPPNQTQIFTQTRQSDTLGRISEKYGKIDGESYKYTCTNFDSLGRPLSYKEKIGDVSYKHYGIIYNELGDVAYEKIKVTAESGTGIFSSKTTVLTEYWYGYDEYGQSEKIKENEIYRKTTSNPIGQIVKAIVGIVIAFIPGLNFIYYAALMALSNFVFSMLSGADFKQALIGAAIAFVASIVARGLSGAMTGVGIGNALTSTMGSPLQWGVMDWIIRGISLIDSIVASKDGKSLMEKIFGKNADIIWGVISAVVGFLEGGKGITGPPALQKALQGVLVQQLIGRLIVTAVTEILKRNASPYITQFLSQFLNEFVSSYFSFKMQDIKTAYWDKQGFQIVKDEVTGKTYLVEKDPISNRTVLNEDGSLNRIDILNEYGDTDKTLYPNKTIAGGLDYYNSKGYMYTTAINPYGGGMDYYDQAGVKRLSLYSTGWTEVFDSVGKSNALIPPNAEIVWNSDGTIKESFIKYDNYTEYYNKEGTLNGRIVEGYTALKQGDQIIGQYKDTTDNTYIYRDASGRFVNKITITPDGGVLATDGNWTTSYSNANIKEWSNANISNSPIYYYDKLGQEIEKIRYTSLDPSGAVQGFMEHNLKTGDYDFLDPQGNKLIPTINPQKIVNNTRDFSNYIKQELKKAIRDGKIDISNEIALFKEGDNVFALDEFASNNGGTLTAVLRSLYLGGNLAEGLRQLLFNQIDGGQDIAFQRLVNLAKSGEKVAIYEDKFDIVAQAKFNNLLTQIRSSGLSKDFNISYKAITVDNLLSNLKQTLQMDENGIIHANLQENPAAALAYEQYQNLINVFPEGTPNLGQKLIIGFNFERKPLLMPDVVATYMGVEYLPTMTFKATGVPWKDTFLTLSANVINSAGYLVNGVTYTTYKGLELGGLISDLPAVGIAKLSSFVTKQNVTTEDVYMAFMSNGLDPMDITIAGAKFLKTLASVGLPAIKTADKLGDIALVGNKIDDIKIADKLDNLAHGTGKVEGLMNGINPKKLNPDSRFGPGVYLSEDVDTVFKELSAHQRTPQSIVNYSLNPDKAKILDYTDPVLAQKYGYIGDYPSGQSAAQKALADGYNVIKSESVRNPGYINYTVIGDFDNVLVPQLPLKINPPAVIEPVKITVPSVYKPIESPPPVTVEPLPSSLTNDR